MGYTDRIYVVLITLSKESLNSILTYATSASSGYSLLHKLQLT